MVTTKETNFSNGSVTDELTKPVGLPLGEVRDLEALTEHAMGVCCLALSVSPVVRRHAEVTIGELTRLRGRVMAARRLDKKDEFPSLYSKLVLYHRALLNYFTPQTEKDVRVLRTSLPHIVGDIRLNYLVINNLITAGITTSDLRVVRSVIEALGRYNEQVIKRHCLKPSFVEGELIDIYDWSAAIGRLKERECQLCIEEKVRQRHQFFKSLRKETFPVQVIILPNP